MKDILNHLTAHKTLSREQAREVLVRIANGEVNQAQIAAFLTVYLMRSITVEELGGFREAMLALCVPVDLSAYTAMDLCGTGGDGKDTFNISTLSSFVVAAAGQPVAKHGNTGVSSICGSSNLLASFGYAFTADAGEIQRNMEQANICFLHAPLFHPAMKQVAPIRRELGVKTFFNMLGPMVNPSSPKIQLVGVFSLELARLYGYLYQQQDARFGILHALDGYDEVSLTGAFKLVENSGEGIYYPADLGLPRLEAAAIKGGDTVEASAKIFLSVLKGEGTAAQEAVVLANAGTALKVARPDIDFPTAVEQAREALKSGRAYEVFKKLVNPTVSFAVSK